MSLTAEEITAQNFKDFYDRIRPYLNNGSSGGTTYTAGNGIVIDEDEISTDNMESTDLAEIVTDMPSVQTNLPRYSTEEQKVGYWIDGKPIYQKTIINIVPNNRDYQYTITDLNIDTPIYISGVINCSLGILVSDFNTPQDSSYGYAVNMSKTSININTGGNRPIPTNVIATIKYTKTTDTPI